MLRSHYEGRVELIPGIEPGHRPYQGRRLPLHQTSVWSEWRDSNPHLKAWKARRRPLPHIRIWFGLRESNPSLRAGNAGCIPPHPGRTVDRCRSPAHRDPSVVKDPALASLVGGKGFEPNRSPWENGFTARQRTIHSYRPLWRQRQDSNPDPRALEARMLPLHHAAAVT